ncbi:DUF4097 family beta strand repeat-containing protein [Neolewinella persica]|uniref:hypothetical protein n=1 Tax=Neolewinella persica TaxID=70998 RepID=UPI0003738E77|nr:hypothetical protein [Neolewinella persica]
MKRLFQLLLISFPILVFGQGDQQEIALEGATAIHIYAAFSSVSVTTGGQGVVAVNHTFTVDGTDRPDLRLLSIERKDGVLHLREVKPTADLLQGEFSGKNSNQITGGREGGKGVVNGVMVDATLEIVVPAGVTIEVETNYGGIKAVNVDGLVKAHARYGAIDVIFATVSPMPDLDLYSNYGTVDVTIPTGRGANLDLVTEYGELLTDMEIQIDKKASEEKDFFQRVIGTIAGGGARIKCEAPYGDVYLREG